jgi:transposase InsO family protein
VPNRIITNNGSQFTSGAFQGYCEDLGIQICYVSVAHLESNGQVERSNAEILKGLKTRTYVGLEKHGKSGSMSFRVHYGVTGHHLVGQSKKCLSFCYTGLRPSSPRKSPWAPSVSRYMTKPCRTSSSAKMLTLSTKEDGNLLLKMHGTDKHSGAINSNSCVAESYRWTI